MIFSIDVFFVVCSVGSFLTFCLIDIHSGTDAGDEGSERSNDDEGSEAEHSDYGSASVNSNEDDHEDQSDAGTEKPADEGGDNHVLERYMAYLQPDSPYNALLQPIKDDNLPNVEPHFATEVSTNVVG